MENKNSIQWWNAIKEELESMKKNEFWHFGELPKGLKPNKFCSSQGILYN